MKKHIQNIKIKNFDKKSTIELKATFLRVHRNNAKIRTNELPICEIDLHKVGWIHIKTMPQDMDSRMLS